MPPDELVLGIPRARLPGGGAWRGILYGEVSPFLALIDAEGTYRPRGEVEEDPAWKQIIPYVVLRDRGRIFLMRRTLAGGDVRLHERYSIGIGGHVNPADGGLAGGLRREWHEELVVDWEPDFRPVGLLNDDTDPVGAVHLGVVYSVEAAGRPAAVRETDKLEGDLVAPLQVLCVYDRLETWSSLTYDYLFERARGIRAAGGGAAYVR